MFTITVNGENETKVTAEFTMTKRDLPPSAIPFIERKLREQFPEVVALHYYPQNGELTTVAIVENTMTIKDVGELWLKMWGAFAKIFEEIAYYRAILGLGG